MCGIFGAVLRDGEVDVEAALASIAHRGPDARGVWQKGPVTLGHTRLAVIDLSPGGAQPMASADGDVVVVFNGEIYNHHALRKELERAGHAFRSRSDTEVIVEGYRAWGEVVFAHLDGMFAIGIWDASKRRLVLGRDRAGKKPLFYTTMVGDLRFASEPKALFASGSARAIDPSSLPHLMAFGYVPAPRTLYDDVVELPPATLLVLDEDVAPRTRRYWHAPFVEAPLELDEHQTAGEIRRLTEAAVRRRLEADVPLGAFLSGGIDSTIIVGLMARAIGDVKTFSIGFSGDAAYDETSYAREAARAFGTAHTEFRLDPVTPALIERLVGMHDGPFGDSSAIPTSIVSRLTREHVTVALSGDGGDELFCGYVRFLANEAVERIPRPLRHLAHRAGEYLPSSSRERSLSSRARRLLDVVDGDLAERIYRFPPLFANMPEILRPELRSDDPLDYVRSSVPDRGSTLTRILDQNFATYLPYDLLVKADRSSMMHGLEVRAPFLDRELVEFAARLPDRFRRRGTTTKWILRRAFADLLPPSITRRGKMGFGVPLATWFRGELREYLCAQLASSAMYDYVDRAVVEAMLEAHLAGRADHGQRLWLLLTLAIWLRAIRA